MSELNDVIEHIAEIFSVLNIQVPSENTDLFEEGLLDSLMFVELLVSVEQTLGVTVTLDQLEPQNFRTIRHIAMFVIANEPTAASHDIPEENNELEHAESEHQNLRIL